MSQPRERREPRITRSQTGSLPKNSNDSRLYHGPPSTRKDIVTQVPREIFLIILGYLTGVEHYDKDPYADQLRGSLCAVSRPWCALFTPILYSRFEFDGKPKDVVKLWIFLRTLVERPELAQHVTYLTLTTTNTRRRDNNKLLYANLNRRCMKIYEEAFAKAGLDVEEPNPKYAKGYMRTLSRWFFKGQGLKKGYQVPLQAVIIALCPNLVRLNFHVWQRDNLMERIVQYATTTEQTLLQVLGQVPSFVRPLQKLEVLNLAPSTRHLSPFLDPRTLYQCECFFLLPSLKDLQFKDIDMIVLLRAFENRLQRPFTTTNASIGYHLPPLVTDDGEILALSPMLKWFHNVKQLSLTLPRYSVEALPNIYQQLWSALHFLRDQLEYLDIFQEVRGRPDAGFDPTTQATDSFCAPFAKYPKLIQLCVTPLMLLGNSCKHSHPEKLRSHLPPNLVTLGLYTDLPGRDAAEPFIPDHAKNFPLELEGVVVAGAKKRLTSVVISASTLGFYKKMSDAAKHYGVQFHTMGSSILFNGGASSPFAAYTYAEGYFAELQRHNVALRDSAKIIPRGMNVYGYEGTLRPRAEISWDPATAVGPGRTRLRPSTAGPDAMDMD